MKKLLYSSLTEVDNEVLTAVAKDIARRVVVREKANLQAHFLDKLYASPASDNIVLCGSVGLHGVFLHHRWSEDVDLTTTPKIAAQFVDIASAAGLSVALRGRRGDITSYTLQAPSVVPNVSLKVEVIARNKQGHLASERRMLTLSNGTTHQVLVRPLAEIIAVKFGCIKLRMKALDFVDIWWGLNSDAELKDTVLDYLVHKRCVAGDFTPIGLDARIVRMKLEAMQETWSQQLNEYMAHVPNFDEVNQDFEEWLAFFAPAFRRTHGFNIFNLGKGVVSFSEYPGTA